jgi:hypothetical protein
MNGEGRPQGPPLKNLAQHWTRGSLVTYVVDPASFTAANPRLKALQKRYGMPMPSFLIDKDARQELADYLLTLK